ncbi:MAG: cell division protein FtsZ [Chloroflexi bacterium]|nr:cell division protein FtsZ [Chloroflexota bacterium]
MTTEGQASEAMSISQSVWVRFATKASERWLAAKSEQNSDMLRFAAYIRKMRYLAKLGLEELADDLQLPYEQLALLESGLLKPSEVPGPTWVRLMRLLEGREQFRTPIVAAVEDVPERDLDELWAMEETPLRLANTASVTGTSPMDTIGIARIKVIGIGGGGTNAVARMYKQRIPGVEYAAVNTDAQHLLHVDLPVKLRMGDRLTRGLGVGGDPELGREAAEESREDLYDLINGTDLVFLACGMGGGTGTGSAPVIAAIARETGALTIAAVTKPFNFEGKRRLKQAEDGIAKLRANVDTLILIPNDRLANVSDERMTAEHAFRIADDVLRQGVESIAELITVPGEINLDFADVKTVMAGAGPAWMAIGHGRGENRAVDAARAAMASPLLDVPVEGATRVLLNITGGEDLMLQEVQAAADYVADLVDPEANIIFGMVTDPKMDDEVRVTVIATGLPAGDELLHSSLEQMLRASVGVSDSESSEEGEAGVELPGFLKRFGFKRRDDS